MDGYFDQVIERRGTDAIKWDLCGRLYGSEEVLPFWVADMDFPVPGPVLRALTERVEHPVFGYTKESSSVQEAVVARMQRLYSWNVKPGDIHFMAGVVPSMAAAVRSFSSPGDGVICMTPVYPPFYSIIKEEGRTLLENPLRCSEGGEYSIDYENLEELASRASMLLLCSPHNPVGRVWRRDELQKLAEICSRHNLMVISDEIHGEIIFPENEHIPFASLNADTASRTLTCIAASKTFNVAGLATSVVIGTDPQVFSRFKAGLPGISGHANLFGLTALEAAFTACDDWLDGLISYLDGNRRLVQDFFASLNSGISSNLPEATFLSWLDCSGLGMDDGELKRFFAEKALVGLNPGVSFGEGGEGHMRLNFGCPRALLEEGLERIASAV